MRASTSPQFLISGPPEKEIGSLATGPVGPSIGMDSYVWEETKVPFSVGAAVQSAPDTSAVREFCDEVSKLGALAVMVEELEGGIQHITTFLAERSPELESEIYRIEANIIRKYSEVTLDFHLRSAPKDEGGKPELPDGPYYLLTWRAA